MLFALPPAPPADPLALEITAPRSGPREGEPIAIEVWIVNRGRADVTVVAPEPARDWLGFGFTGGLWRAENPVASPVAAPAPGLWTGSRDADTEIDVDAFAILPPGGRLRIEATTFCREYAAGRWPARRAEVGTAPTRPLPAGAYVYRAEWIVRFRPPIGTLTPEAKRAAAECWTGRLRAESPVTIVPATILPR